MQLVEQGKVELDAPVQRYVPWFRVADPAASAQITVRQLLRHTSGIAELLLGREPAVVALNPAALGFYSVVMALAALQLLGVARSIVTLRRWSLNPPGPNRWRHVWLPLARLPLAALVFLVVVPALFLGGSLLVALLLVPDLGVVVAVAGTVALVWSALSAAITLRLLHRPTVAQAGRVAPTPRV